MNTSVLLKCVVELPGLTIGKFYKGCSEVDEFFIVLNDERKKRPYPKEAFHLYV
ncbi:hypothetical protein [Tindallia magadiensis]|uniref:hypothetical protein n=1 Tax=Tindallia magadiensis TaxID=69895 RepID=UPI0015A57C55|nr:hypothetical protein [Tindallia magadiensis]